MPQEKEIKKRIHAKANKRLKESLSGVHFFGEQLEAFYAMGLQKVQEHSPGFLGQIQRRLIDFKCRGLAERVGQLEEVKASDAEVFGLWLTRNHLLQNALLKAERLPLPLFFSAMQALGWDIKRTEVVAFSPPKKGIWQVLSEDFERLNAQLEARRYWLYSPENKQFALLLDFSFRNAKYAYQLPVGAAAEMNLHFYPSAFPQRAVLGEVTTQFNPPTELSAPVLPWQEAYAEALEALPWLEEFPCMLELSGMRGGKDPTVFVRGREVPLQTEHEYTTLQLALRMEKVQAFGLWNGRTFTLKSISQFGAWLPMG